jgi:hypothetical protein
MDTDNIQFEVKFFSSDHEWTFPATKTFKEMIEHIEGYYLNITLQYNNEGFNVLSNHEHIGTIKPCYPTDNKVERLHKLFIKTYNKG